uniref:EF-hand domain-containing protein n=1 Tax=Panthera tigris altaica TaxID=74533 RepID=A0A8C9K3K8_PANTA
MEYSLSLSCTYLYFYFTVKKSEVECLVRLFHSLVERANVRLNNLGLDRNAFGAILHSVFGMTDDMLMNRVFFVFDKDHDNCINVKEWVKGLSVFLRGTFEEKLKYCELQKSCFITVFS